MGKEKDNYKSPLLISTPSQKYTLEWDGEVIEIDLMKELRFNENDLTGALLTQPVKYGWLLTVRASISNKIEVLEKRKARLSAIKYISAKSKLNVGAKVPSNEQAKMSAESDPEVTKVGKTIFKYRKHLQWLNAAIMAFEQRFAAIQTLSANRRKEKE